MSRFKNPVPSPPVAAVPPTPAPYVAPPIETARPFPAMPNGLPAPPLPGRASLMDMSAVTSNPALFVGFIALWLYLFSWAGYVNEISLRNLGIKPYISFIAGPILFITTLVSGQFTRAAKTKAGRFWLALGVFILLSAPFSVWRSDTATQIINYIPRVYMFVFFIGACAITLRRCQWLIYANIIGGCLLILLCLGYGTLVDGRFVIEKSSFENPNALALHLVVSGCMATYLLLKSNVFTRVIGVLIVGGAMAFMLRTASRGSLLASMAAVMALFLTVKMGGKIKIMVALLLLAVPAVFTTSEAALARIVKIVRNPASAAERANDESFSYAVSSQMARTQLLMLSLQYTITHPLFGVGLGQFGNAVYGDFERAGKREGATAAGTHNSFTQVSSECGIPAAICYTAVIFLCLRANRRLYIATRDTAAYQDIANMALCLFITSVGLSVNTFFYHIAFGYYVPALVGMTIALNLAAKHVVKQAPAKAFIL